MWLFCCITFFNASFLLILTEFKNSLMIIDINAENPDARKISQVVDVLQRGGVIIYPTDSVYGLGCDIYQKKGIERICRLRNLNPQKANLTIICKDISQLSEYTQQIDNAVFKLLKRNLPGPFTFILKSSRKLPKSMDNNRKTLGIRIPDNNIAQAIIEKMGNPILSISLKSDDEITEYFTDPYEIHEDFEKLVDMVIDGGIGDNIPSAVIDVSEGNVEILRQGGRELIE
ncbi:MAG: tRNA threonylcarbamoyl adenosine modification protein (Sua5/YciO/YrdC/YwlC family) [Saprospiraceae bacterium]